MTPYVRLNALSKSESELLYDWRFTANQFVLSSSPLRPKTQHFFQVNTCGYSPYVPSFLTGGWVCHLQLLLELASAVILGSDSRETHDHILLSQIRDSPNLEDQVPQGQGGLAIHQELTGFRLRSYLKRRLCSPAVSLKNVPSAATVMFARVYNFHGHV
jgi:hypothetical protein